MVSGIDEKYETLSIYAIVPYNTNTFVSRVGLVLELIGWGDME